MRTCFSSITRLTSLPLLFILSACGSSHPLVDTPNLYSNIAPYEGGEVFPELKTTNPDIFFVTDRHPDAKTHYNSERSTSMAFGTAQISFGEDANWDELNAASSAETRDKQILLELVDTKEIVRFPETPLPFYMREGQIITSSEAEDNYKTATKLMQLSLREQLAKSKKNDVILFVHGFNNDFRDAALATADIWHFTGRNAVPIFYTWPAASGGLLSYFKDRESGEFSIFHFKETLRILSAMPEIENIHIVAHSRGTDITTTALRELVIETRAASKNPRTELKIENLMLAAPDLDFGVVRQRLIAEKFGPAFGQITVYINQEDNALSFAQYLMSGLRFGVLADHDLSDNDKKILDRITNVHFINVEGIKPAAGHSYYRQHPGVLSDIIITINDQLKPGESGRPLEHKEINFWTLPKNYPEF